MKAVLVSLGTGSHEHALEAMKKYFTSVEDAKIDDINVSLSQKGIEVLYQGKPFPKYDCIYLFVSSKHMPLFTGMARSLCAESYLPTGPDALRLLQDRLALHEELSKKGIPIPQTYAAANSEAAKKILKKMNYPIVVRVTGYDKEKGLIYAESSDAASKILETISDSGKKILLQEYVETGGSAVKALVIGDKVAAAIKRRTVMSEGYVITDKKTPFEAFDADAESRKIAIDAARAAGADICSVDLFMSVKGPVVSHISLNPNISAFKEFGKIDAADEIAKFLFERVRERKEAQKMRAEDEAKDSTVITSKGL